MNKDKVRSKLIELASDELAAARAAYDEHLQASKPIEDEAVAVDEVAQNWSEAEIAEALEGPVRIAEAKVAALDTLDFGPKEYVEPGAIATVDGQRFVIGVSMDHFTVDGADLIGLSPAAPLYQAIEGLGKSETATFDDRAVKIEDVI
ncbi:hypothetical protein [Paracoccus pacificus]|uniref:Phage protein Gp19/Gp15/Gp42 n=1 Tax=Paracoccus pacificus TaxID=1463598 RepID=A0ABW4R8U0_9RHOB